MSDAVNAPPSQETDLEQGIFHLTIALCHKHEGDGVPRDEAKERVARYLERLITGLRMQETNSEGETIR